MTTVSEKDLYTVLCSPGPSRCSFIHSSTLFFYRKLMPQSSARSKTADSCFLGLSFWEGGRYYVYKPRHRELSEHSMPWKGEGNEVTRRGTRLVRCSWCAAMMESRSGVFGVTGFPRFPFKTNPFEGWFGSNCSLESSLLLLPSESHRSFLCITPALCEFIYDMLIFSSSTTPQALTLRINSIPTVSERFLPAILYNHLWRAL